MPEPARGLAGELLLAGEPALANGLLLKWRESTALGGDPIGDAGRVVAHGRAACGWAGRGQAANP